MWEGINLKAYIFLIPGVWKKWLLMSDRWSGGEWSCLWIFFFLCLPFILGIASNKFKNAPPIQSLENCGLLAHVTFEESLKGFQILVVPHWDHLWKRRGGIMMNGVPKEVPRPKPERPQAPKGFGRKTSQGTPITKIPPMIFHTCSFFCHPGLEKRVLFQPMDSLGSIMVNVCSWRYKHW